MTTLHDRLADLADDAPPGGPAPGLWDRGRQYHRRRRAGTAVIVGAAVLVLATVVGIGWTQTPHEVAPARPGGELRLPDRLYTPSPWLPGTDETGPIGPVVAVLTSTRGSEDSGIVGVSAAGAYAFLDLEDLGSTEEVEVSPNGRWVAYPLVGDPEGEPNTSTSEVAYVGLGVHDTVTGETERLEVRTEHGLQPATIAWGGSTVWWSWYQYVDGGDDGFARSVEGQDSGIAWDLASGEQRMFDNRDFPRLGEVSSLGESAISVSGRRLVESMIHAPETEIGRFDVRPELGAFVSPDISRVALLEDTDDASMSGLAEPLAITEPRSGRTLVTSRVPGPRVERLLGWRDDGHVVIQAFGRKSGGDYLTVDVVTGERRPLMDPGQQNGEVRIPQDVWQAEVFDAPAPPDPMNPRTVILLWGAGAAVVLVAGAALVLWRRRVRA